MTLYRERISNVVIFTLLLILVLSLLPILPSIEVQASPQDFTHNVLVETVTSNYCLTCQLEEPIIMQTYGDMDGAYISVAYHVQDEFANQVGLRWVWDKYGATGTPSHFFDGGTYKMIGAFSAKWLNRAGTRPVHRIGLTVEKTIDTNTIHYSGSIQELDGKPFEGLLRIFIVENHLYAQKRDWNFVFRDFGIEGPISLKPNEYTSYSGEWIPSSNYNSKNIMIVASVWQMEHGNLYSIQATNDEYSDTPLSSTSQVEIETTSEKQTEIITDTETTTTFEITSTHITETIHTPYTTNNSNTPHIIVEQDRMKLYTQFGAIILIIGIVSIVAVVTRKRFNKKRTR